jgi:hypothetical protein
LTQVEKLNLLTTEARVPDGRLYIIPNVVLYSSEIVQLRRTSKYAMNLQWHVISTTTREQTVAFDKAIREWLKIDTEQGHDDSWLYAGRVMLRLVNL